MTEWRSRSGTPPSWKTTPRELSQRSYKICDIFSVRAGNWLLKIVLVWAHIAEKSHVHETLNLSMCADSSTNTIKYIKKKCESSVKCDMSHIPCHMSHVPCHKSHVKCQMSQVTCYMSNFMCHVSPVTCPLLTLSLRTEEGFDKTKKQILFSEQF